MRRYSLGCWNMFVKLNKWAKPYRKVTYHDFCNFGEAIIDWIRYPCNLIVYGADADKRFHFIAMLIRELYINRHFHFEYIKYFDRVLMHNNLILTKAPEFEEIGFLFCGEYRDAYRPDVCRLLYAEWEILLKYRLDKKLPTILCTHLTGEEIYGLCGPQNVDKLKTFTTVDVGTTEVSPFNSPLHKDMNMISNADQRYLAGLSKVEASGN